mmetsp:Transcript_49760/g.105981  ORF Transcript_49760/g.105981 Transcript_49760/m.105981 type:complete len:208 (+) Transcript_49760:1059-1682(+)
MRRVGDCDVPAAGDGGIGSEDLRPDAATIRGWLEKPEVVHHPTNPSGLASSEEDEVLLVEQHRAGGLPAGSRGVADEGGLAPLRLGQVEGPGVPKHRDLRSQLLRKFQNCRSSLLLLVLLVFVGWGFFEVLHLFLINGAECTGPQGLLLLLAVAVGIFCCLAAFSSALPNETLAAEGDDLLLPIGPNQTVQLWRLPARWVRNELQLF